uniref:Uncharacterized protein n=1 Tax=Anguilla anguilla TaxID=7936 RepID=A0A0E9Q244_ANGAN
MSMHCGFTAFNWLMKFYCIVIFP